MLSADSKSLDLPERQSLTMVIFDQLERMILSGIIRPGEPINEKALSESNGLSRAPIREACRRLEQAGLVEIIVNKGAFVKTIDRRDAEELCDLRLLLAEHAGRLALKNMSEEDVDRLPELMIEIEAAIGDKDIPEFYSRNYEFHMRIIGGGGNDRLTELYESLSKELSLFRWRALKGHAEFDEAASAHREIVAGLKARDERSFLAAMKRHLEAANRRLLMAVEV